MILSVLRIARRPVRIPSYAALAGCLAFSACCLSTHASPERVYFIGNSFTWDGQPNNLSTATVYPNELDPTIGWSIFSGKSLTYIVENPEKFVTEVGLVAADYYPDPEHVGNYETDLSSLQWDALSIQPHTYGGGLFLDTEIEAANTVITKLRENVENQTTTVYIYGPWAFQESPDKSGDRTYSENWLSGYSQNQLNNNLLPNVRQAFRSLFLDPIQNQNPSVTLMWIPVGEVLYRIDQELQKGTINGLSGAWDLFDQYGVHLHDTDENGIAGRYISHIVTLCTIWGADPSQFQTKYNGVIDSDFKALVDQIAWATILEIYPDIESCQLQEQAIQFQSIPHTSIQEGNFELEASSESNLPVQYELVSGPATIEEGIVYFNAPGSITIQANQAGNNEWCPAPPVTQSFEVYSVTDAWRLQTLGTHRNEGDAADLADPDFDNLPNIFEYFLGTSPTEFDLDTANPLITVEPGSSYQSVQDASSVDGLEVWFEWSENMVDWFQIAPTKVDIVENLLGDKYYTLDTSDLSKPHFVRLRLSQK